MQLTRKRLVLADPAIGEILLHVSALVHGGFGVYADALLLAIHPEQTSADAHCQRLRDQQDAAYRHVKNIDLC